MCPMIPAPAIGRKLVRLTALVTAASCFTWLTVQPANGISFLGTDAALNLTSRLTPNEMFRWNGIPTVGGEKIIRYRLDPNFTPAQVAAINSAFATWDGRLTAQPNTVAGNWGNGDLESIALHEIGHALGLAHSGVREEGINRFWDTDPNPLANDPFNMMMNPDRNSLRESLRRPTRENFAGAGISSAVMTYDVLGPNRGQSRRRLEFDDLGGLAFGEAGADNLNATADDFRYRLMPDAANPNGVVRDVLRAPGGRPLTGADESTFRNQSLGGDIDVFAFNPFFFNPGNPRSGNGLADMVYDRRGVAGAPFSILGGDIYLNIPGDLPNASTFQGTFDATLPVCDANDVCNGLGTSSFNTGTAGRTPFNIGLDFFGARYPVEPQGVFSVGMLTVRNGETLLDSTPALPGTFTFLLDLHVQEFTAGIPGADGDILLAYFSSPNVFPDLRDPRNADILYNPLRPEAGGLWVLEGSTLAEAVANVSLLMRRGSLEFEGFFDDFQWTDFPQNGFLADLPTGNVDPDTGFFLITPIPEPAALVMLAIAAAFVVVPLGGRYRWL